jgi:hypothetical protein
MPVYFTQGVRPQNPVNQTAICQKCTPTMATAELRHLNFDSERDAHTTWNAFGQQLLNQFVPPVWTALWNNFKCTNPQCAHKDACGAKPTFVEAGSDAQPAGPGQPWVWILYITIAREIQCLPDAGRELTPEVPQIPKPEEAKKAEPKSPEPKTPETPPERPHEGRPSPGEISLVAMPGDVRFLLITAAEMPAPTQKK